MHITIELTYRAGIGFCLRKISVPFLDFKPYTVNSVVVLIIYSNEKMFHSRCPSSMSYALWTLFSYLLSFIFILSTLSIIRYMFFICFYFYPRIHYMKQLSKVLCDASSKVADSLQQIIHVALVLPIDVRE